MKQLSDDIRIRYQYRKLIIQGKVTLSHEAALRLIGPDCAYHLYSTFPASGKRRPAKNLTR